MYTRISSLLRLACFVALSLGLRPGTAQAGILTFEYTEAYAGAAPAGEGPWLRATFSEGPAANEVVLVLEAVGLSRNEFVSTWLFNLDPDLDPRRLLIVPADGLEPSRIRTRADRLTRGGARFDLAIDFPTRHASRFDQGDHGEFLISWREGAPALALTPESFAFTSSGKRTLFTAAHIQGIGWCEDDSGWVTGDAALQPPDEPVPEPATLLLLGSGVLGLAGLRRRRGRG